MPISKHFVLTEDLHSKIIIMYSKQVQVFSLFYQCNYHSPKNFLKLYKVISITFSLSQILSHTTSVL